tara:strand:- start:409 stop:1806 length:1398 start_codon:yes stop_codon:yes gene_type:complete
MKTLQEQYNLIKEGKGHKDVFLKDAKSRYPGLVTNASTFKETSTILKSKAIIQENYVDLKPITKIESLSGPKQSWETKFASFLAEAGEKSLNALVNNKEKINTKEEDEKIKADSKKVAKSVENIESHNYDYSPKVDNVNNVNGQEMLNGVYFEVKNNPDLSLEEAQAEAIKNLAKDPLHYVKEGQFGVNAGYQQEIPGYGNTKENTGESYGGSGYSEKLKDGDTKMQSVKESKLKTLIKESLGGVVTSGNPNSLAAQSGNMIRQMMAEDEWQQQSGAQYHKDLYAEENSEENLPMDEAKGKDHDGDGDVDSDDYMAARDKAIKSAKAKKPKKESIDTKLSEIGKAGDITKLEAQLEFLSNHIDEKIQRVSSINEDDNLKELIDRKKMKDMQKEIKLLEKRKGKMEKVYEKMCGKKYKKMVDESEEIEESFDKLVSKLKKDGKSEEDAKKIAGAINRDYVGNYKDE